MKNLFFAVAVLFACNFAHAERHAELPAIFFPQSVTVDNVCVAGETLKTIKPVSVCLESAVTWRQACDYRGEGTNCRYLNANETPAAYEFVSQGSKCVKSELQSLTTSRTYLAKECTEWFVPQGDAGGPMECIGKWVTVAKKHALTYIYDIVDDGGESGRSWAGRATIALPACAK